MSTTWNFHSRQLGSRLPGAQTNKTEQIKKFKLRVDSEIQVTMATEKFQNLLRMIQNSGINYKMEVSPFSAIICIKNCLLKDQNGKPLVSLPSSKIITETDEPARKILKQESVIKSLRDDYGDVLKNSEKVYESNKKLMETIEVLHSKLVTAELETIEMKKKLDEVDYYVASQDNLKTKLTDVEAENKTLRETVSNLDSDVKKKNKDFLALTRKLNAEHLEHQKRMKELNDFCDPIMLEERKLKRKEKASMKKKAKAKRTETNSSDIEDPLPNDDEFVCTICAKIFPKSVLSVKSIPEESDSCETCNKVDADTNENLEEKPEPTKLDAFKDIRNRLERPVSGKVGTNALENNSVDDSENNSIDDLAAAKNSVDDDLAAANNSTLEETKSCEMKEPVIEAKEDNILTKAYLKEVLESFKAGFGT